MTKEKKLSEPDYTLNPDGTTTLNVPMGNKIKHLTFDYTETATLAANLNACEMRNDLGVLAVISGANGRGSDDRPLIAPEYRRVRPLKGIVMISFITAWPGNDAP